MQSASRIKSWSLWIELPEGKKEKINLIIYIKIEIYIYIYICKDLYPFCLVSVQADDWLAWLER